MQVNSPASHGFFEDFPLFGLTVDEVRRLPVDVRHEAILWPATPGTITGRYGTDWLKNKPSDAPGAPADRQSAPDANRAWLWLLGLVVLLLVLRR